MDFIEELREKVRHDTMACIGCNDCLLACPLPESKAVTIAELNQAVTSEQITAWNVLEFVNRCTQCQQCVPVCPADLSRADIVLWNKMKAESVAPDRYLPLQAGEQIVTSQWTVDQLASHLITLPLFGGVKPLSMRRMLLSATLRSLAPGEVLVREGAYHQRLIVVVTGALEQSAQAAGGQRTRILVLDEGTFHGHMSVLSNSAESFTISAIENAVIVEFTKAAVVQLMREAADFSNTMETLYEQGSVWTQARSSPVLSNLPPEAVDRLLEHAYLRVLRPGEVLYREGDPPSGIYLVKDGFLRVARQSRDGERVLQYFHEGDVCGATALLFDRPESATVSANTRSEVIEIPAIDVFDLLRHYPELRARFGEAASRAEEYLHTLTDSTHLRPSPSAHTTDHLLNIEGLLEEGVVQGTEVLVIDTAICTNCNNCVDSCERRHGYSRLHRGGLQMDDLLFPTACRHCEDPVCLLCSVNGIVREPDGEIRIVDENCIGCGACAERCPYGNINMHDRNKNSDGGIRRLISFLTGTQDYDTNENLHSADAKGNRIAVKCDLCAGYDDYACVTGCPVGAAIRINPIEVFGRTDVVVGLQMKNDPVAPPVSR
ncbi:MAG TPA: cyclic nucleotide-binding domain-containing protein [Actinomycetota bacterium]|nr:cyclic nucleotide-binding domain-containing protein [Actinomycetota bacterium]